MRKLSTDLVGVVFIFAMCLASWPSPASALCVNPIAEIVSAQGDIELNKAPAKLADAICPGDVVKVGTRSRAAIVILETDTVLRIDQDTELRMRSVSPEGVSLLDLLQGAINLLTPAPRSLEINTPVVNAAVEGTEFYMRVDADRAVITVFDGRVTATNDFGRLSLSDNESAVVVATRAPKRQVTVRPRDAVQWALYYPPIGVGETASPSTHRAAELLAVGRVDVASGLLDVAIRRNPNEVGALALKTIIAVAQNRNEEALRLATDTVSTNQGSAVAHIALSYAQQANFRLDLARQSVKKAVDLDPDNALAWARLSELWLSEGRLDKALDAARSAADRDPGLSRTQTVLGFAYLTRINISEAKQAFENAIERDQADPLPRLGLGLTKIRRGDLAAGRRNIEIAATLDPNNSLVRSYLGKAYFEEKRGPLDGRQFAIAKALDPNDPTPWFYDAIRKQTINRPVDALHDLQKSIELNGNRAVYRSRLLLDQDLAARGASLARIYRDLGFEKIALIEGFKSINTAPDDHSGHRLLADTYAALPRHEIARVSELLQSQLLQPQNVTPVQPRLGEPNLFILQGTGPAKMAFNEFNAAFLRNRLALQVSGVAGDNDTLGGELVQSGVWNKVSYSLGAFHYETDGFRDNNDQDSEVYNAFVQGALTPQTSIQVELRKTDFDKGDLELTFTETFSPDLRQSEEAESVRLGLRHEFSPGNVLLASYIYRNADLFTDVIPGFFNLDSDVDTNTAEIRQLLDLDRARVSLGLGRRWKDSTTASTFAGFPAVEDTDSDLSTVYAYSEFDISRNAIVTVGATVDFFDGASSVEDQDEFNPKLGILWNPRSTTTVRAAAYQTLQGPIISRQNIDPTLEPTQIAGFNQFFFAAEGDRARSYGVAVDERLSPNFYGGVEILARDLDVPIIDVTSPVPAVLKRDWEERIARGYLYWTYRSWLAFSTEFLFERFEREAAGGFTGVEEFAKLDTYRFPIGIRVFHPSGFNASVVATYVDQEGDFVVSDDFGGFSVIPGEDEFWVVDATVGYRLPKRRGLITLDVKNLFEEKFNFQDTDPGHPRVLPDRQALVKFILSF